MPTSTFVFPRSGGLVLFDEPDRATIVNPITGWSSELTGQLARDALALLASREPPEPRLVALGDVHAGVRLLLSLAREPYFPSTPARAIRLEGFATLFVELVGRCNERCTHCYAEAGPSVDAGLSRATCDAIIDDAAALGFSRIQFTGGDPLLCAFLPELLERARERGIPEVEVYTNGLALGADLLERLAPSRPRFAFSFYSHDPDTHDHITQTPGSHLRTSSAIRRTLERGLAVRVGVISMAENASHLDATFEYLRGLGVQTVAAAPSFAVGRGQRYIPDGPAPRVIGNAHDGASAGGEPRRTGKLCVTYEGKVVPCIFNRNMVLGDLEEQRLLDIASRPAKPSGPLSTRAQFVEQCRDTLQCGGCRVSACALHWAQPETA